MHYGSDVSSDTDNVLTLGVVGYNIKSRYYIFIDLWLKNNVLC